MKKFMTIMTIITTTLNLIDKAIEVKEHYDNTKKN